MQTKNDPTPPHLRNTSLILLLVCHESMHGFSSYELIEQYKHYVESEPYLKQQHAKLKQYGSNNEEEFVAAAECYLRFLHCGENKKDLSEELKLRYDGCMPSSSTVFNLLTKESNVPVDYNAWLLKMLKNGIIKSMNI